MLGDYKTSTPISIFVIRKTVADLVEKIFINIEEINNNLDVKLNSLLLAINDIEREDPGLYEIDGYISEIEEILKTVDMDGKSSLIKKIQKNLEIVFEMELQRMETGYKNDVILEIIEGVLA